MIIENTSLKMHMKTKTCWKVLAKDTWKPSNKIHNNMNSIINNNNIKITLIKHMTSKKIHITLHRNHSKILIINMMSLRTTIHTGVHQQVLKVFQILMKWILAVNKKSKKEETAMIIKMLRIEH